MLKNGNFHVNQLIFDYIIDIFDELIDIIYVLLKIKNWLSYVKVEPI